MNKNTHITSSTITKALKDVHNININTLFSYPHSRQEELLNGVFLHVLGEAGALKKVPKSSEIDKYLGDIEEYYKGYADKALVYFQQVDKMRQHWRLRHPKTAIANITKDEVSTYLLRGFHIQDPETLFQNPEANKDILQDVQFTFTGHHYQVKDNALLGALTPLGPKLNCVKYEN